MTALTAMPCLAVRTIVDDLLRFLAWYMRCYSRNPFQGIFYVEVPGKAVVRISTPEILFYNLIGDGATVSVVLPSI